MTLEELLERLKKTWDNISLATVNRIIDPSQYPSLQ
jgi:Fe2+ or Zn2+ uptake regulation protein